MVRVPERLGSFAIRHHNETESIRNNQVGHRHVGYPARLRVMNTKMFLSLLAATSFCLVAPAHAAETAGEETAEAVDATKKTTKRVAKEAANTTKDAANKVGNTITKATGPEQKVDVNIGSTGVTLAQSSIPAGPTLFSVLNHSEKPHKIAFEGGSLKKTEVDVAVNKIGKVQMNIPAGTYKIRCNTSGHHESTAKLTVK